MILSGQAQKGGTTIKMKRETANDRGFSFFGYKSLEGVDSVSNEKMPIVGLIKRRVLITLLYIIRGKK